MVRHRDGPNATRLLDIGADTETQNSAGETPIIIASQNGDTACVNILLEAACNVNHISHKGLSALGLAISQPHAGNISLLLRAGADPTKRNSDGE